MLPPEMQKVKVVQFQEKSVSSGEAGPVGLKVQQNAQNEEQSSAQTTLLFDKTVAIALGKTEQLQVKQTPACPPKPAPSSNQQKLSAIERDRLRVACAVVTAAMTHMGKDDLLTQQFLAIAMAHFPADWDIPGWENGRIYFYNTVRQVTTWRVPSIDAWHDVPTHQTAGSTSSTG